MWTKAKRDYQVDAKRAVYASLRRVRSTLLVMPTGTGKTILFSDIIADGVRAGRRMLVIAHRAELIEQAVAKIAAVAECEVAVEMGQARRDVSADGGTQPVVVASVRSLINRLDAFEVDAFDLIVIDEAHHAVATTYTTILQHFDAKILGVTATPNRGDDVALRAVFDEVAFDMTLLDAIEDGWLVPIRQERVPTSIDLSACRRQRGDFNKADLERVMTELDILSEIAVPIVRHAGERQALVFAVTVTHARLLAEALREALRAAGSVGVVGVVTGKTPPDERAELFRRFRAGELKIMVNVEVVTEGVDLTVPVVAIVRPTQSRTLFMQMVGRGTRPLPRPGGGTVVDDLPDARARREAISRSSKPHMLVIDFTTNSGRHALVDCMDLLGGKALEAGVELDAREIVDRGETDDLIEALRLARARRARRDRELLARFDNIFALWNLPVPAADRWSRPSTPEQRERLIQEGVSPMNMDGRQAHAAILAIAERSRAGLSTYKQTRAVFRFGLPLEQLDELSRRTAAALLAVVREEKWRPPSGWWLDLLPNK